MRANSPSRLHYTRFPKYGRGIADQDELLQALAKGLIGSAANLALPGLGSLAAVAVGSLKGSPDVGDQISNELLESFAVVRPREAASRRSRIAAKVTGKKKREARQLLEAGGNLDTLLKTAGQTMDSAAEPGAVALPEPEPESWAALGKAQLAMANSAGFVPGLWQDEFAALLQTVCEGQMRKGGAARDRWRRLIGVEDGADDPAGRQLTDVMRCVTRVFAARIAANSALEDLSEELRQSDYAAAQYALLWRLDQQRRSLALIAAILAAFAAALGIGIDVLE